MDQNLSPEAVTLTKTLCARLAAAKFYDLSVAAKHQARRGVLDWIGCALAGSGHKTISTLLDVLQEVSGRPQATARSTGVNGPGPERAFRNGVRLPSIIKTGRAISSPPSAHPVPGRTDAHRRVSCKSATAPPARNRRLQ